MRASHLGILVAFSIGATVGGLISHAFPEDRSARDCDVDAAIRSDDEQRRAVVAERKMRALCDDLGIQVNVLVLHSEVGPDAWFGMAGQLAAIGVAHCGGGDTRPALVAMMRKNRPEMTAELQKLQRLWCPTCTAETLPQGAP